MTSFGFIIYLPFAFKSPHLFPVWSKHMSVRSDTFFESSGFPLHLLRLAVLTGENDACSGEVVIMGRCVFSPWGPLRH